MPLPDFFINRYKDWKENNFPKNEKLYRFADKNGQCPKAMVISCCDSRVHSSQIFQSSVGELFIYRNIANLVPSILKDKKDFGTLSAIEYATKTLKVPNIVILGHSKCGGINYAYKKFSNEIKSQSNNFLDEWIETIRPAYDTLNKSMDAETNLKSLELQSIKNSLTNLKNISFINNLLTENKLNIHGLWFEIGSGSLMNYNQDTKKFENLFY